MKHYCPMCGEQWNDDVCETCGWREGKQLRYTEPRKRTNTTHKGRESRPGEPLTTRRNTKQA